MAMAIGAVSSYAWCQSASAGPLGSGKLSGGPQPTALCPGRWPGLGVGSNRHCSQPRQPSHITNELDSSSQQGGLNILLLHQAQSLLEHLDLLTEANNSALQVEILCAFRNRR
ncbi:hypothetical protein AAFF_G00012750 [Aldrovandia affinis]|uniref:Uncharacterized protein n=1 Tax=Aldrovandia affinis TaxID=143900 RepID=A0AAD7S757_9TELE|nr:hypothetical protein AAFF_G00012750 [Aldrovandia affinis]